MGLELCKYKHKHDGKHNEDGEYLDHEPSIRADRPQVPHELFLAPLDVHLHPFNVHIDTLDCFALLGNHVG